MGVDWDRLKKPRGIIGILLLAGSIAGCALLWASLSNNYVNASDFDFRVFILMAIAFFNFAGYLLDEPSFYVVTVGALLYIAAYFIAMADGFVRAGTNTETGKKLVAGTVLGLIGAFGSFLTYPMNIKKGDNKHLGATLAILAIGVAGAITLASQKYISPTVEGLIVCCIFFISMFTKSSFAAAATLLACGWRISQDLFPFTNPPAVLIAGCALLWASYILMTAYTIYRMHKGGSKGGYSEL